MTQYYADADAAGPGDGSFGDPWTTIDQFTESARSAGDILTCRRGTTAQYDNGTDVTFTSNGAKDNPIIIEADYDDSWTDFANSTQTYTMVFGSKTHTASATITGISAGDWIYNTTDSDDPRELSYEVASVSGTTLTLKLPYKGSTGATKTLKVMPPNPIWGATTSHAFEVTFNNDEHWFIQGLQFSSSAAGSSLDFFSCTGMLVKDVIIDKANTGSATRASSSAVTYIKCRLNGAVNGLELSTSCHAFFDAGLIEGMSGNATLFSNNIGVFTSKDSEFTTAVEFGSNSGYDLGVMKFLNCDFNAVAPSGNMKITNVTGSSDHDNTVGNSAFYSGLNQNSSPPVLLTQEEITTVRSGGSNTSIKVTPGSSALISTNWELSQLKLLELPIYATTDNKTYDIYMRPTATTDWTTDPTASELWLELEAWGHATNNFRKITKSTGVIDMNGSTAWQKLSVTVAPAQSGVAFLRLWYAKPVEASKANSFFIDPIPVIT